MKQLFENKSGRLKIKVSEDRMSAWIDLLIPPKGQGLPVSCQDVEARLADHTVLFGVRMDAIERAVADAAKGRIQKKVLIAVGEHARDERYARVDFRFQMNRADPETVDARRRQGDIEEASILRDLVVGGDALAVMVPYQPPEDGWTVTHEKLTAKLLDDRSGLKELNLNPGREVGILADGFTLVVERGAIGYADLYKDTLQLIDPLTVSKDGLLAQVSLHPPSQSGRVLTSEWMEQILVRRGILYGIDLTKLTEALKGVERLDQPLHGLTVAKGLLPARGRDAKIRFLFRRAQKPGTRISETGSIDFKERGLLQNVEAGDLLAVKRPATSGREGIDLFNRPIPAVPGKDVKLASAGNATVSPDGLRCVADVSGVVTTVGADRIGVFQHYTVNGDVDYSTGNITIDGTVEVKGWVRSGFSVCASGDILIHGGIEDATVEAGANIDVRGGIIGRRSQAVRAGGGVRARFLESVTVFAKGDVIISDSVIRSDIFARGKVVVTQGRGSIIGGACTAVKGVEANELGADSGAQTRVTVGINETARKYIMRCERELIIARRSCRKVSRELAALAPKPGDDALDHKRSRLINRLAKLRREETSRRTRLRNYRLRFTRSEMPGEEEARITIHRSVYQGVVVNVRGYGLFVEEPFNGEGGFALNPETKTVEYQTWENGFDSENQGDSSHGRE